MKKKNGFVFVETMIVVVVLVSILLIIYSSYTSLISLERRQSRYDDPLYINRTYAIGTFLTSLMDENQNSIIGNKLNEYLNDDSDNNFILIPADDQELFMSNDNSSKDEFFNSLINEFNVQTILMISESKLKNIEEEKVSSDFYRYLKSIDTSKEGEQFYFAIIYAETVDGEECDPNDLYNGEVQDKPSENSCTFYYANLEIEKGEMS